MMLLATNFLEFVDCAVVFLNLKCNNTLLSPVSNILDPVDFVIEKFKNHPYYSIHALTVSDFSNLQRSFSRRAEIFTISC